jgi:hypothetical protein
VPVEQHGAGRAEAGTAAELRATQTKDVSDDPEQRGLRLSVVNLDLSAVHDKLHMGPRSTGSCGLSCTGRRITSIQVSCPHRIMVIPRYA